MEKNSENRQRAEHGVYAPKPLGGGRYRVAGPHLGDGRRIDKVYPTLKEAEVASDTYQKKHAALKKTKVSTRALIPPHIYQELHQAYLMHKESGLETGLVECMKLGIQVSKGLAKTLDLEIDAYLLSIRKKVEDELRSESYEKSVRKSLRPIARRFVRKTVSGLFVQDFESYLDNLQDAVGKPASADAKQKVLEALHAFYGWMVKKQKIEKNIIAGIDPFIRKKKKTGSSVILPKIETIREMFAYLEKYDGTAVVQNAPKAPGFLIPYFALTTFAPVRADVQTGEISRINLASAFAKDGKISISEAASKVLEQRTALAKPNLLAFRQAYFAAPETPIIVANMIRHVSHIRKKFGLTDNCLRHMYLMMRLAETRDVELVARELGTSLEVIQKYYRNTDLMEECQSVCHEFFAITPTVNVTYDDGIKPAF